jgi:hypothetical protein
MKNFQRLFENFEESFRVLIVGASVLFSSFHSRDIRTIPISEDVSFVLWWS